MYLGLVFLTDISCHKNKLASHPDHPLSFVFRLFLAPQLSGYGNWTVVAQMIFTRLSPFAAHIKNAVFLLKYTTLTPKGAPQS